MTGDGSSPSVMVRPGPALATLAVATCPLCHTPSAVTDADLAAGQSWRCARCGQRWDHDSLAGAATYASWLVDRAAPAG